MSSGYIWHEFDENDETSYALPLNHASKSTMSVPIAKSNAFLNQDATSDNPCPEVLVRNGKVEVILPEWVNAMVFDRFRATHRPAGRKRTFDRNLHSDNAAVLTYLGTYFPRSLAESFVIFDSLLSDKYLANLLACEERISICSVGTGTGGDLFGLILAINKRVPSARRIEVVSIEGNVNAHETMRDFYSESKGYFSSPLNLALVNHIFEAPDPFAHICEILPPSPTTFDFIVSSKMLNELDGEHVSKRPYYEFCSAFTKLLKPTGVLMVLDVTSSNGGEGRWTPTLLNGQVNEFLADCNRYKTILPLLCNRFEGDCGCGCYTQNAIYVSYRNVTNECSKICYRVIGSSDTAEWLSCSPALWDCAITKNNDAHCLAFRG